MKIGDFGTSKHIPHPDATTFLKTTTGTQGYMAPEVQNTSKPKTNKVDIWSLGCILYQMVAGRPLFKDLHEVMTYSIRASSPPPEVEKIGFSAPCVSFLCDVLQPRPKYRPSAEACLKQAWTMSKDPGSEYSIGWDLYNRLCKLKLRDPRLEPLADVATNLAPGVHNAPVREPPDWKLNYRIGSGTFGTIFLEKVHTRGMGSPELWAVKRIPKVVPNFPTKRYQEEVKNLQALSNVSFVQAYLFSQRALVSFNILEVLPDLSTV